MDIKTNGSSGNLAAYVNQTNKHPEKNDDQESSAVKSASSAQAPAKKDAVTLSAQAGEISRAQQALKEVPDVNLDKVNELKNQIENGTYQMDPGRIAGAMLNDLLMNQISTK